MNDINELALLYESMTINRTGSNSVNRQDISDFLYQITNGGNEVCSVFTIRKNNSKNDPSKKAGMPMQTTGRIGSCKASRDAAQYRNPNQDTPVQYRKNKVLKMCVTSVDGVDYTTKFKPKDRTRSFDVTEITKISAGGEEYNIV